MNTLTKVYTRAELEAWFLVNSNKPWTTNSGDEVSKAADQILELAERIKNQRIAQIRHHTVNK